MKVLLIILSFNFLLLGQTNNLKVSGFVDLYYAYDFNKPLDMNRSYTTQPLRHNEFNLNLATLGVTYSEENARGSFTFQTGTYVQSNLAAEPSLLKNIYEASVGTKIGSVWIDAGIFPSHIGLEGIQSNTNWTYSRSLASDFSPFYETGVKVSTDITNQFSAGVMILNGWQNINETNSDKAFGSFLKFVPSENILANWSTFFGNEVTDSLLSQFRIFNDFYYQQKLSDQFQFAALFDIGIQQNSNHDIWNIWHTGYLMIKYIFSSSISASARVEYFYDSKGIIISTGTNNNYQAKGASINLDYSPAANVLWRVELRSIISKDKIYPSNSSLKSYDNFIALSSSISF
jgi:hypothetical protein